MQYIGGKSRIASWVGQQLAPLRANRWLIEPFCGGLSVTQAVRPDCASDASVCLISLYNAMRAGWEPPTALSEAEYLRAKALPETDPLHAFAAFGCSYGGKYWGGFARSGARNYALNAANSLRRKINATKTTDLYCCSFTDWVLGSESLVYCDPPYNGTTQGYSVRAWDSDAFWAWVDNTACRGAIIVISEFKAPRGVPLLAQCNAKSDLHTTKREPETVEKLFILGR